MTYDTFRDLLFQRSQDNHLAPQVIQQIVAYEVVFSCIYGAPIKYRTNVAKDITAEELEHMALEWLHIEEGEGYPTLLVWDGERMEFHTLNNNDNDNDGSLDKFWELGRVTPDAAVYVGRLTVTP